MVEKVKNNRNKGILMAILASSMWSTGGIFVKIIEWNPVAITGIRSLFAAIVLLLYAKKPKFSGSRPQIIGSISYAVTVLSFITANKLTTSANAILLQYTSPIFVAILSVWILRDRIKWYDLASLGVVSLGMGLFFVNDLSPGNIVGNLLAILCGFTLAITTISLKLEQDESPFTITIFGNILAFVVAIPFIVTDLPSPKTFIVVAIMGVVQLGIPFIFYINGMKYISALEAILITVMEPLLNPVWVFIFAGEAPGLFAIIGGFIVITSVTARSIYVSKTIGESE